MSSNRLAITGEESSEGVFGSVITHITKNINKVVDSSNRAYARVAPYVATAFDYAWFAGSAALLLSLPILVEVQRETTVLVFQKQREMEMQQMQEQVRMSQLGVMDNMKDLGNMVIQKAKE